MKNLLLVANKIPHYRVSVYNYFDRRFRETGYQLIVASDKLLRESSKAVQFELHELQFNFREYQKLIEKLRPEVVLLHLHLKIGTLWPLIHWLKLRSIPVITWTKGGNLDKPKSRVRQWMFNYTFSLSGALLMYSRNETRLLRKSARRKAFIANNSVNSQDYPEIRSSKYQIKKELGINFGKVVLFVGTMGVNGDRKRVKHLIEIFGGLARKDVGLIIVGTGLEETSKTQVKSDNILILGAVHDPLNILISKIFKASDIYVVPGHVGLGINQAFYWGLPVITEACNQPPEIHYVKQGRNGFIVPDNDIHELERKMFALLDDDMLRGKFAENAKRDIKKYASIEGMFQSFSRAIDFLCGSPKELESHGSRT